LRQGKGEMETFFLNGRRGRTSSATSRERLQTPILNGLQLAAATASVATQQPQQQQQQQQQQQS